MKIPSEIKPPKIYFSNLKATFEVIGSFTFSKRLNGFLHIRTRRLSPPQTRLFVTGFGVLKRQIFISNSITLSVIILVRLESHLIFEIESFAIGGGNIRGMELMKPSGIQSYPCLSNAYNYILYGIKSKIGLPDKCLSFNEFRRTLELRLQIRKFK